jgi:signal transduction histidine kinase
MEKTSYARRPHDAGVLVSSPFGGIRLARVLWILSLVVVASALLFGFLTPDFLLPVERPMTTLIVASLLLSLAGSTVGALVASRRPRNPVGWIFLSMGVLYGVRRLVEAYADYALLARPGLPLGEVAAWASTWLRLSPLIALGTILVLLFPEGKLPSARWRTVAFATGGGAILVALGDAFRLGPLPTYYYVNNPFGIGGVFPANSFAEASTIVGGVLLSASCFASILALALHLRHAHGPERRRLAWFAYAAFPALLVSATVLLNWSIERFALLVFGKTFSPLLRVAEVSVLFVRADQPAGTIIALRLAANLELLSACAILTMPICAFVAMRRRGLYGMGGAAPLPASRWLRVLLAGAIAGILPLAFVYLAVFLYVIVYPLAGGGEPEPEQLARVVTFVSGSGAHVFFFALTLLVAFRIARKAEGRAVVLGTAVGFMAAFVDRTISAVIGPAFAPGEIVSYLCLGLAGGYFGGLAGRSTLAGGVYRVSRQIGDAKDASAVAAAIGENLGDMGIEGVAIWRKDAPEIRADSVDGDAPQTALWGSWSVDQSEGWSSGLDPGETGSAMLVARGGRSWAMVQRSTLAPDEQRSWESSGVRSALLVPLDLPEGAWRGLLMVAFRKRSRFSRRAARAYLTVASQATVVLENLRLVEEARRSGRRGGVLVERQRLAREIHDTLAQGFTGVITNLTAAELAGEPHLVDGPSARYIHDAKRIARDSLAETRRLVWALRPALLDRYSLTEAVQSLVAEWSEQTGVKAVMATNGAPRELIPEAEAALLRAVQEALTNVHKHARAGAVNVTLTYMEDRVVIDVLDDGDGFDPAAVRTTVGAQDEGGFGLIAMRERIEQLGGKLIVESTPGEGTAIVAELRAAHGIEEVR